MNETTPEAGNSSWNRIEELFHAALDVPSSERQAWLAARTSRDPGIRKEVQSLLAAQQKHEELSNTESARARPANDLEQRLLGEFCGPYRLDRLIGQGGMAWVYEGVRVTGDFRQRVAVKVLPAVFGEALTERFRQEKQILAELNHPGIGRLLDGGVNQSGLSYLVMEYVEGERISFYADHRQLSRTGRIRLFLKVCEAVAFAHTARVIHRDIKPANILVTTSGQPKLLDFGIARLMDQEGAGHATLWRAHTPGYASPEQLRGETGGVAADVYQLGVLLGELLTGDPPSKGQPATDREAAAAFRKSLGADLAAVLVRARRLDPRDRYRSVSLLADDLNRYLEGLPVEANRGTLTRRAVKFARRYRGRLAALNLLLLLLIASAAFVYQVRVRKQERIRRAQDLYRMVIREGVSIGEQVTGNQPELASGVWRRLRDSAEQLQRDDPGNPMVSDLLGHCYLQLGTLAWYRYGPSLMDPEAALQSYNRARTLLERADNLHPGDINTFWLSLSARMFGSEVLIEKGRGFDAFGEVAQLLMAAETRRNKDAAPLTMAYVADLASFYDMLSDRLGATMSWPAPRDESPSWYGALARLRSYQASDSIAATVYRDSLSSPDPDHVAAVTKPLVELQLGRLDFQAGLREQGIRTLREAERGLQAVNPGQPPNSRFASIHGRLANAAEQAGNLSEALRERQIGIRILEAEFQRAGQSPYFKERLGEARLAAARVMARLGQRQEALKAGRLGIQFLGEGAQSSRATALTLDLVAQRLLTVEPAELRDAAKALVYARKAVEQTAGQMPPYLVTLAFAQHASGLRDEARRSAIQAIQGYQKVSAILKPLFEQASYPEARRMYGEFERQLDQPIR
ncbi:MAG TPA: protein kinase [Bryobacteraceae bacterium]|nr:protein kinase [Bryobacteraceae bacterium]